MKKLPKITIRRWEPRTYTYRVTHVLLQQVVASIYTDFDSYVYMGWVKRTTTGNKKEIVFIIATAPTRAEAKSKHKHHPVDNISVWEVKPAEAELHEA